MSRFAPLERRPIAPVPAPKKPVGAQRRTHARRTESPAPIVTPFGRFPLGAPDHSSERDAERLAAQSSAGQPISRQAQALIGPHGRAGSQSGATFPRLAVPSGDPLPDTVRHRFERMLSVGLGSVRIHTDARSADFAGSVGARAVTLGQDIFFGARSYDPHGTEGRALLAHELVHTVQQRAAIGPIQRAKVGAAHFQSPRFVGDPVLDAVIQGRHTLKKGATGLPVIKIQQALVDLGFSLPVHGVNGLFRTETEVAVVAFQRSVGLRGSGEVDRGTLKKLDEALASHKAEAAIATSLRPSRAPTVGTEFASGTAPPELTAKTRPLTRPESAAAGQALEPVPEIDPTTGRARVFNEPGYAAELETKLNAEVTDEYNGMARGRAALHADPRNLHSMSEVEAVANLAQQAVDKVFGAYAKNHPFDRVRNLRDRWTEEDRKITAMRDPVTAADPDPKGDIAKWRVQKIINEDETIASFNEARGAIVSRPREAAIIQTVRDKVAHDRRLELLEIQKGWPGAADPATGRVFLQLFKSRDASRNRAFMWRTFKTMIHEYIHTLAHSNYRTYVGGLTDPTRGHALREGMTDYLTKIVWATINTSDVALRRAVEGPYFDPAASDPISPLSTYPQAADAEQMVGIVGIRNAFAAYFLGEVRLIGR